MAPPWLPVPGMSGRSGSSRMKVHSARGRGGGCWMVGPAAGDQDMPCSMSLLASLGCLNTSAVGCAARWGRKGAEQSASWTKAHSVHLPPSCVASHTPPLKSGAHWPSAPAPVCNVASIIGRCSSICCEMQGPTHIPHSPLLATTLSKATVSPCPHLQHRVLHPAVVQLHVLSTVGHHQHTLAPDHQVGVGPHGCCRSCRRRRRCLLAAMCGSAFTDAIIDLF